MHATTFKGYAPTITARRHSTKHALHRLDATDIALTLISAAVELMLVIKLARRHGWILDA